MVGPGPDAATVKTADGKVLKVPAGWELLPPGDAGLTRRVKANSVTWTVQEKRGRKLFSRGVWADAKIIQRVRADLEQERASPTYAKRKVADANRREKKQTEYVEDFQAAVLAFLDFAPQYASIALQFATAVTEHATPVGSGTVARTERIPIDRRAEAAVIAWMRHQTTGYDDLKIPRVRGERREVRRMLAEQSRHLLHSYRRGLTIEPHACPLMKALKDQTHVSPIDH